MLASNTLILQAADITVLVAGALAASGWAVHIVRRGRWRDPLGDVAVPAGGPGLGGIGAALLALFGANWIASAALFGGPPPEGPAVPGSDAWHRQQGAHLIASAAASVVMIAVLYGGARAWRRPGAGARGGVGYALGGLLILLPLVTVQYQAGQALWLWLRPDEPPPIHMVLRAIRQSAWGSWGALQVLLQAVVLAPLAEELFFRGLVLQTTARVTRLLWPSIVFSAMFFGLVHIPQPQDVLPLVTMGGVLGYVRVRSGALWPCILLHMLFNGRTMAVALLAPEMLEPV